MPRKTALLERQSLKDRTKLMAMKKSCWEQGS
jgi:hypothetical protein